LRKPIGNARCGRKRAQLLLERLGAVGSCYANRQRRDEDLIAYQLGDVLLRLGERYPIVNERFSEHACGGAFVRAFERRAEVSGVPDDCALVRPARSVETRLYVTQLAGGTVQGGVWLVD